LNEKKIADFAMQDHFNDIGVHFLSFENFLRMQNRK
jgi:hypothetical protein